LQLFAAELRGAREPELEVLERHDGKRQAMNSGESMSSRWLLHLAEREGHETPGPSQLSHLVSNGLAAARSTSERGHGAARCWTG
jgi:hypothetical protein